LNQPNLPLNALIFLDKTIVKSGVFAHIVKVGNAMEMKMSTNAQFQGESCNTVPFG